LGTGLHCLEGLYKPRFSQSVNRNALKWCVLC
jgi:hypothetical protein